MADSMRSINSFGVAGLLDQKCDVFYTNDLRARNIGRVADLVSAKLRGSGVDEVKIRALLVFGAFQTYAVNDLANFHQEKVPPVSVEIGVDEAHVAVAISFHWDSDKAPKWKGLAVRVDKGQGSGAFEKSLEEFKRHSTQVIVRYEVKERRIEIVSILNRIDAELIDPTMVVSVDSTTTPLLEVSNYVELGDLNYSKLLKTPVAEENPNLDNRSPQETLESVVVGGSKPQAESTIRFQAEKVTDSSAVDAIREKYESTVSELKNRVHELTERLTEAEAIASERRFTSESETSEEETVLVKDPGNVGEKNEDDWGLHFLKQVWPFAPKEDEATLKIEKTAAIEPEIVVADEADATESDDSAEVVLQQLKGLSKENKSEKVAATLREIEAEAEPDKAKRWVDSLSSELLQEKARLNELQQSLTKQIRQRELEFKTAERALKQELKRKDDLVSQRQASIENKNDQIAQLNLAVERAGAAANDKEAQQIRVKLERAQRLAQMKDEEAKSLVGKVRDLENRLIIAQAKSQKGNDLQLISKVTGLEKKVDEYKRINQRLMESLNSQKEKSNDKEVGDLRRKIDQLDRLLGEGKRNLEKSAFKMRELQESERKLQTDFARAVEENRNLRKTNTRSGGESDGQAA